MQVIEHNWKWARTLGRRAGAPPGVVLHHAAARAMTPEQVHAAHLANGWAGIGYHYYVRKDGSIHRGRSEWAIGSHAVGHNTWLGVCFEGNYETEKTMPAAQLRAGQDLVADLRKRYPKAVFKGHGSMPGNATACPGRHFPMNELLKGSPAVSQPKLVPVAKRSVLKQRLLWYAIDNGLSLRDARVGVITAKGEANNAWGDAAQTLAWRVSGRLGGIKQSTQPTVALQKALKG